MTGQRAAGEGAVEALEDARGLDLHPTLEVRLTA
jgi:hypothetical protein